MQTLDQFVAAHLNKYLDFDGAYGAQCVDLVKFYCRDVLGIPPIVANAIDEFGKEPEHLLWTGNDPHNIHQIPAKGDIIIWGANTHVGTGVFGHTAVVLVATETGFTSFDQNWPVGAPCHQVHHTYEGIKGWGRLRSNVVITPKPVPPPPAPKPEPEPIPVPPPVPIERPKMYLFSFVTHPDDVMRPITQVTTLDSAIAQAQEYCESHRDSTCDVVFTVGPIEPPAVVSDAQE